MPTPRYSASASASSTGDPYGHPGAGLGKGHSGHSRRTWRPRGGDAGDDDRRPVEVVPDAGPVHRALGGRGTVARYYQGRGG